MRSEEVLWVDGGLCPNNSVVCCCRETQISATDSSVIVRTSCLLMLDVSQNPHLGFLLYTFQIICFCSPGFSSCNAQSIAPILLCFPQLSPMAQPFSIAVSAAAVKPLALFNNIKNYFLTSSSSHCCFFSFLQSLESLPVDGQNQGCIFDFLFCKHADDLYLPVSRLARPSTRDCSFSLVLAAARL